MSLAPASDLADPARVARRRQRQRREHVLRGLGVAALAVALGALALLLATLLWTGAPAFTQTRLRVEFPVPVSAVDPADPATADYRALVQAAVGALIPGDHSRATLRAIAEIVTPNTPHLLRDAVIADPSVIGGTVELNVPVADPFDQLNKGQLDRAYVAEHGGRISVEQIGWFDALKGEGLVSRPFNAGLFLNGDSRFPEMAGLRAALVGTLYVLAVALVVSVPIGVATAIYLQEFAARNRATTLIEVNINTLAAVPSIVFGLLGLAVFIQAAGMPRSSSLVGGLVLALMMLPTIIIVTRTALASVPRSVREAAFAVGASRHQVVLNHVLPLALPGILTGTTIGLAHVIGEAAALLLIGMNVFLTSAPSGLLDASTALPTQIFLWSDSPGQGFVARTSAGIIVLLVVMILMNAAAIFLRQKLERRW